MRRDSPAAAADDEPRADSARGFILQATYRIQRGAPEVRLYGILEQGGTFLVRDRRQVPHFYVRRRDAALAWRAGATRQRETARRTFAGDVALRIDVAFPRTRRRFAIASRSGASTPSRRTSASPFAT